MLMSLKALSNLIECIASIEEKDPLSDLDFSICNQPGKFTSMKSTSKGYFKTYSYSCSFGMPKPPQKVWIGKAKLYIMINSFDSHMPILRNRGHGKPYRFIITCNVRETNSMPIPCPWRSKPKHALPTATEQE